ncbi:MAG TPA: hypothetical protein VET24_10490 [Actinomycetota bacterium]|nr:hypothetical protein [Actinomycetota bacterium]
MAPEVTGVCAGMVGAPAACIIVVPVPTINAGTNPPLRWEGAGTAGKGTRYGDRRW